VAIGSLYAWWIWYWCFSNKRIADHSPPYSALERLARTLGHIGNLSFSFLLFPIARNSIWDQLYGIPFDRAIKYHRWLGYFTVGSWFTHFLVWSVYYAKLGAFWYDLFTLYNNPHFGKNHLFEQPVLLTTTKNRQLDNTYDDLGCTSWKPCYAVFCLRLL
jgi:hypothetical protein